MAITIGDALLKLGVDTRDLDKGMKGIGANIKKHQRAIGLGMAAAGGAILAGFALSAKAAADFEGAMREVNTMMGLTQDEFVSFSEDVNKLSTDLGVDAVGSAKALYQAISAGVPKENALEFLKIATKAAIGGITDTETAVDGLTSIVNAFKLPISDAQKVADIMFTTVKGGKTTFEELSAAIFNVAPIAAAAGISFEDVSAALATMTKQGVPTKVATTQLRAAIQQLLKPMPDMIKQIEESGIAFYKETEATIAASNALSPLIVSVDKADAAFNDQTIELDKLRLSYQLTTAEMAAMTEEMDELGDQQAAIRLEIRKIRFEAAEEGRELTDAEKADIASLGLDIEKLGIAYDELAIKKDDVSEAAEKEVGILKIAEEENIALAKSLKNSKEALEEGEKAYASSFTELRGFSEILDELNKAKLTTPEIVKMFGSIEAGSAILSLTGRNAEMFAADLKAMTSAEGAATAAFLEMEESTNRQMTALKQTMAGIQISVGNILLPILAKLVDRLMPVIENVLKWVKENPKLTATIVKIVAVVGILLTIFGSILMILPALSAGFTIMLGPVGLVILAIAGLIAIGVLLWKNWDWIKAKAISVWTSISRFFESIWQEITDIFGQHWDKILAILFPAIGLPVLIARNWGAIVEVIQGIWEKALGIVRDTWDTMMKFVIEKVQWLMRKIGRLIDLINSIPGVDIGDGEPGGGGTKKKFYGGGLITEPTLLTRVGATTPYGIMAERGPERIVPGGGGGYRTANIIVMLDSRVLARELGAPLVDLIRIKTGAKI